MENYETSLKGISALLKSKLNTLEDLDSQIIASCEDENMDKEPIEATDYEMNVHLCSAEIEDALEKLRLPIPLLELSQHVTTRHNTEVTTDRYARALQTAIFAYRK